MILYGSSLSPFVRKAAAFAAEKGIEVEHRPTSIGDPNPEFRAASPFGKMPALIDGDFTLADSSAIVHYWEAKFPEPALIPAEPEARGRTIWFDEFADTILFACGAKLFFNRIIAPRFLDRPGDLAAADAAERDELPRILDYLEGVLPADGGWLVGNALTLADLAVASPLVNLAHCDVAIDAARFPRVTAFAAKMHARPSFAAQIARESAFLSRPST